MIRGLDASSQRFLDSLEATQRRLESAQRRLSSGRKLTTVSDAPDQVANLLQTRAELSRAAQIRVNLGSAKAEADTAEQALQQALVLMDRALVLGAQGASGTQTAETRRSLAAEVEGFIPQMVGFANTSLNGRYLFSGDADQAPAYALNPGADPPYSSYLGADATREAMHPSGTRFAVARTAQQIFDHPETERNVLGAIEALRAGLAANDPPAIEAAVARLKTAAGHLNSELAFYGRVQNQIASAAEAAHRSESQLKTVLAGIEDADITEAILELNLARHQQEAALGARARMPRTSLFDFLR